MKYVDAEFVIGAARADQFPNTPLPEVAFAGRSNVGKSSLLNALLGRKALARVSHTPGRTQQINFFRIDNRLHYVDLPGYGYAKVSQTEREAWVRLIESYLRQREQLKVVVALSDIRHDPPALDLSMFSWLDSINRPFIITLTKLDKVSQALADQRIGQLAEITKEYQCCTGIIAVSSHAGTNLDRLRAAIGERV